MVPTEEASIQKTEEKLKTIEISEMRVGFAHWEYSLARHFLNKLQANLSLSNTPHSIQQKGLSLPSRVICVEKMPLELSNDFRAACEPIARIWHKGNDPIGHRPIAIIVVDDLREIQRHQLASFSKWHSAHFIECAVASYKVVSARKKVRSTHVEILKVERFRMREGRKGERLEARRPPILPRGERVLIYFYIPPSTCLSFFLPVLQLALAPVLVFIFSFLGGLPFSVNGLDFLACWLCLAPTWFTPKEFKASNS